MQFERILIRATNWVGDAVMCIPALQAVRKRFPSAQITVLARASVADLYRREEACDEVILSVGPKGWPGISEKLRLIRQLKERCFDCALLFQNAFEAAALMAAARIPVRIGYDRDARGWLLTQAVRVPRDGEIPKHQRFYYLELLRRAGWINELPVDPGIRISGAAAAAKAGQARLFTLGITGSVVGVSPGAAYGGAKRWLPERFAQAGAAVAKHLGGEVLVFGTATERVVCEAVSHEVQASGVRCRSVAGETSLSEYIELAAACEVYITNDSGPMHIASALGVRTVAVFGPTDEFATGPTGDHAEIVRQQVECSPCLLRECPIDHRCMERVTAGRVADAALHLLRLQVS